MPKSNRCKFFNFWLLTFTTCYIDAVLTLQPTNFDGFRKFLVAYLGPEVPDAICKHLFLSFVLKAEQADGEAPQSPDLNPIVTGNRSATLGKLPSGARRTAAESNVGSVSATASRIWQRIASRSNPALHALAVNNGASPLRSPSPSIFVRALQRDPNDRVQKYASIGAGSANACNYGTDGSIGPAHSRSFHNLQGNFF